MGRILLGGLVGAVIYYVWGMLAWMVLPLHTPTMHGLKNETAVTDALRAQQLETGVYWAPWSDDESDWTDPESDYNKKHRAGPIYFVIYQEQGSEPMPTEMMARGFGIDLLASLLAASLLYSAASGCCRGYLSRVGFVAGLGIFAALIGHATLWNWMHQPFDYTLAFMVDIVAGWTLTGVVMAAIVRAPAAQPFKPNKP